jgi:hypothetical protein
MKAEEIRRAGSTGKRPKYFSLSLACAVFFRLPLAPAKPRSQSKK